MNERATPGTLLNVALTDTSPAFETLQPCDFCPAQSPPQDSNT